MAKMPKDPDRDPNCKKCDGYGVIEKQKMIRNDAHGPIICYDRSRCRCTPPKGK